MMSHVLAFRMIGTGELLIILVILLLIFGGARLPQLARGLSKSVREFKRGATGLGEPAGLSDPSSRGVVNVWAACALFIFAACAGGYWHAQAQQSVNSATLSGRVEDARGAVISGEAVSVLSLDTGLSRGTGLDSRDQTFAASVVSILGPRALNEARMQFTRSQPAAPVNDEIGPALRARFEVRR
jgi:TatA/E family protein of Tat protein translocase